MIWASMSLALLTLIGCEIEGDIPADQSIPPTMELDCYELSVTGGHSTVFIYYAVTNPIKGAMPSVKSNVEWLTVGEITESKIVLNIAESDINEERVAIITVSYPEMEKSLKVYITQDKQLLNKFSYNVTDVTYNSCTVEYIPFEKNRPYMANIIDSEYFKQSGIEDGSLFVAAEMESYLTLAQLNKMTLEELMSRVSPQLIYTGATTRKFTNMQPGATYTIYSYGIEFNGNSYTMTTPLHTTLVTLPMPTIYDAKFHIVATKNDSVSTVSISPENWDGYYSVQIAPDDSLMYVTEGEFLSEYLIKSYADSFFNRARNAIRDGSTVEQFLRANCYCGNQTLNIQIVPGKRYMISVFAVESKNGEIPVMRSIPSIAYI